MTRNNPIVIKKKMLINISSQATLSQRRIYNALLHKIHDEIGDFSKLYFTLDNNDLIDVLGGLKKINYSRFMDDCKQLSKTIVTWNLLETDRGMEEFTITTLISGVSFEKGTVKVEIPMMLREKLIETGQYIKFHISIQNKFTSKYSLILYEFCKEFYREKEGLGETSWVSLEKLRSLLSVEISEYKEFKEFKRWVLNVSSKEINKYSDISIKIDYKRQSRKITHLKFIITKNPNFAVQQFTSIENKNQQETPKPNPLSSFNLSQTLIDKFTSSYSQDYIQSKIDLTISQLKAGKIKTSVSGFLVRAIEEDFGGSGADIKTLLAEQALEARKLNPETVLVEPMDYQSEIEFEKQLDTLKQSYYNPMWIPSELEQARQTKWVELSNKHSESDNPKLEILKKESKSKDNKSKLQQLEKQKQSIGTIQ